MASARAVGQRADDERTVRELGEVSSCAQGAGLKPLTIIQTARLISHANTGSAVTAPHAYVFP